MGKRGPAPKPTKLRVLHGDRPCRINDREPQAPAGGHPECPQDVSAAVRAIWDYTLDQLVVMDLATLADRDALLAYCEAVATHRRASALLADQELIVTGATGGAMRNPAVQIQRDAATLIRIYSREFGFTPSARSEIRTGGQTDGQGAERLLSG